MKYEHEDDRTDNIQNQLRLIKNQKLIWRHIETRPINLQASVFYRNSLTHIMTVKSQMNSNEITSFTFDEL